MLSPFVEPSLDEESASVVGEVLVPVVEPLVLGGVVVLALFDVAGLSTVVDVDEPVSEDVAESVSSAALELAQPDTTASPRATMVDRENIVGPYIAFSSGATQRHRPLTVALVPNSARLRARRCSSTLAP